MFVLAVKETKLCRMLIIFHSYKFIKSYILFLRKKNVAWVRDQIFSFLFQSNSANFCYNDTVLLRFTVTKKKMPILFSTSDFFSKLFFVSFIVFVKKLCRVKTRRYYYVQPYCNFTIRFVMKFLNFHFI